MEKKNTDDLSIRVSRLRRSITRSNSKTVDSFRRSKVKVSGARGKRQWRAKERRSQERRSNVAPVEWKSALRAFLRNRGIVGIHFNYPNYPTIGKRYSQNIRSIVGYTFFLAPGGWKEEDKDNLHYQCSTTILLLLN